MLQMNRNALSPALLALALLAGCGGDDTGGEAAAGPTIDNTAEVQAHYAENPDFYRFRSPEDLPA
jgi:microcin C transport system substrate-binding protein